MNDEQITINCVLECIDFGLNFDKKDIQDLLSIIKRKNEIIKKQSYTNKKMKRKLDNYRKLVKLKDRQLDRYKEIENE